MIGYDCRRGLCDVVDPFDDQLQLTINIISNTTPFMIIFGSYCYIGFYYFKITKFLRTSKVKTDHEFRTTMTIFLLVLFYACIEITMFFLGAYPESNPIVDNIIHYLYVLPYSTDCFIYALSTQFWKAYVHALTEWKEFCLNLFNLKEGESHTFEIDKNIEIY